MIERRMYIEGFGEIPISHAQALLNGQGSSYEPVYADQVMQHIATGYTLASFAGAVMVAPATVYKWAKDRPDFKLAIELGKSMALHKFETHVIDAVANGNTTMLEKWLKIRAADEWAEPETKVEVQIEYTQKDLQSMTMGELEKLYIEHTTPVIDHDDF